MPTGYYIHTDMRDWMSRLVRLGMTPTLTLALENTLHNMFLDTQHVVHVVTGSLKGSGQPSSDFEEPGYWRGEITYGGSSPGFPHNPVTYAGIERGRGGEHDFFRDLPPMADQIEAIIHAHLQGLL